MQENVADAVAFTVVFALPFTAWVISRPPVWRRVRAWLEPLARRLWAQLAQPDEPDESLLRQWALSRLEQLRAHLERVRRLILDDEWMTATRQTANRIAHERLIHDVREAELAVAAYGPVETFEAAAAPTPRALPRLTFAAPAAGKAVEVMEFGPSGRWL
jgi:hypothetical protein